MFRRFILFYPDEPAGGDDKGGGKPGEKEPGAPTPEPPAGEPKSQEDEGKSDSEVAKARKDAARYRTERNDLQKRVEELEGASKSDVEKLTEKTSNLSKENKTLKETNRELTIRALAPQVGIDPKAAADAAKLFDWKEVSDPEDLTEVEAALKEFVKERPHLTGNVAGGADGGAGGSRSPEKTDVNSMIRGMAGRT